MEDMDGDTSYTSSVLTNGGADSDRIWDTINEQSEPSLSLRQTTFPFELTASSFSLLTALSDFRPSQMNVYRISSRSTRNFTSLLSVSSSRMVKEELEQR